AETETYTLSLHDALPIINTEKYYLQKENTKEWPLFFTKLRMNNTTFIEEDTKDREMHKGFYVDIMCLNNAADNEILRYLQYLSRSEEHTSELQSRENLVC